MTDPTDRTDASGPAHAPLLVMPTKFARAWRGDPAELEVGADEPVPLFALEDGGLDVFWRIYQTDAHVAMYYCPDEDVMPRISKAAVAQSKVRPRLGWIIVDVDTPGHVPIERAPAEWIEATATCEAEIPQMEGALRWESAHGLKYAWPLPAGQRYPVAQGEDFLGMFLSYLQRCGLPVDMGCKDWTRVMRLPRVKRDGDPLSARRPVEVIGGTLRPLQWRPPREPVAQSTRGTVRTASGVGMPSALVRALEVDARSALAAIDPDCEYTEWLRVGLALRDQFGSAGFAMWRDWSERGSKYEGEEALLRKWEQLPDHPTESPVTIRTLFHIAGEHGWEEPTKRGNTAADKAPEDLLAEVSTMEAAFSFEALDAAAALREAGGKGSMHYGAQKSRLKRELPQVSIVEWERAVKDRERERRRERRQRVAIEHVTRAESGDLPRISNFDFEFSEDQDEPALRKRTMRQITAAVFDATGGWPRLVDNVLFAPARGHSEQLSGSPQTPCDPVFLTQSTDLFAWFERDCAVDWTDRDVVSTIGVKVRPISATQVFSGITAAIAPEHRYNSVETLPHVPAVEGAYYFPRELPESTGKAIEDFVDLFNPASFHDRCLLEALLLTGAWGGEPGKRPAFVITSDYGRSAGKTSTAQAIARVYGGAIGIKASDRWQELQSRILDPSTAAKRFVLVDNLKGTLSSAEFEAVITERTINGRRLYVGDGERVNLLTWVLTANTASLSSDLASRSVVIKIGAPKHAVDFEGQVTEFLEKRGEELLADIVSRLQDGERVMLEDHHDRFQSWQRDVLGLFGAHAEELARIIISRRGDVDEDSSTAARWAEQIRDLLHDRGHDPDTDIVVIPSQELIEIAREVEHDATINVRRLWGILRPILGVGELASARRSEGGRKGRGIQWTGPEADPEGPVETLKAGPLRGRPQDAPPF